MSFLGGMRDELRTVSGNKATGESVGLELDREFSRMTSSGVRTQYVWLCLGDRGSYTLAFGQSGGEGFDCSGAVVWSEMDYRKPYGRLLAQSLLDDARSIRRMGSKSRR